MRTTIGFDFGTHQTKVCVERRESGFVEYEFMTFKDLDGNETFTFEQPEPVWAEPFPIPQLPQYPPHPTSNRLDSIFGHAFYKSKMEKWEKECKKIKDLYEKNFEQWQMKRDAAYEDFSKRHTEWENERDTAYATYMERHRDWASRFQKHPKALYRYFKQATFSFRKWENAIDPLLLSIWYMAYMFFNIEERYGTRFGLNMGVPTGKRDGEKRKKLAVSMVLSAIPYSAEEKKKADILVFPEAVACLRPLLQGQKVDEGKMHKMIDIGGGTTDISFFTIKNGAPRIFSFQSIPHGLNYLTKADDTSGLVRSGKLSTDIDSQRMVIYFQEIKRCLTSLVNELQMSFEQTKFEVQKLYDALKGRPIIYTGGGSTFAELRRAAQG